MRRETRRSASRDTLHSARYKTRRCARRETRSSARRQMRRSARRRRNTCRNVLRRAVCASHARSVRARRRSDRPFSSQGVSESSAVGLRALGGTLGLASRCAERSLNIMALAIFTKSRSRRDEIIFEYFRHQRFLPSSVLQNVSVMPLCHLK